MSSLGAILVRRGRPDPAQLRRLLEASPHRGAPAEPTEMGAVIVGVTTDDVGDTSMAASGDLVAAVVGSFDDGEDLAAELKRAGIEMTGTGGFPKTRRSVFQHRSLLQEDSAMLIKNQHMHRAVQ